MSNVRDSNLAAKAASAQRPVPMDAVWQDNGPERSSSDPALVVDVDGFEGPLDLLLHLARDQKVDLTQISVLELARQFLAFVDRAKALRIELAADYLVMAAWLAFLKSRLLLPKTDGDDGEPTGEEMAALLQFRLHRLEAMRDAAARLMNRNRLGRDFFARGAPEAVIIDRKTNYSANLYDLLAAYARQRQRNLNDEVTIKQRVVWSMKEARELLGRILGSVPEWVALDAYLVDYLSAPDTRASATASTFAATLELVREGHLDIRQDKAYGPLFLRDSDREPLPGTEIDR